MIKASLMAINLDSAITKLTKEPTAEHLCGTCERCTADSRCGYFNRYVERGYNRCFNHSKYVSSSIKAEFKPIPREEMDKIIAENEANAA